MGPRQACSQHFKKQVHHLKARLKKSFPREYHIWSPNGLKCAQKHSEGKLWQALFHNSHSFEREMGFLSNSRTNGPRALGRGDMGALM